MIILEQEHGIYCLVFNNGLGLSWQIVYFDGGVKNYNIPITFTGGIGNVHGTINRNSDAGVGLQAIQVRAISNSTISGWLDWVTNASGCNCSVMCIGTIV